MKFVDQISNYIHQEDLDLAHLIIVLPSERMKKYLSSALYRSYGKPIMAPKMITMNRWVNEHNPLSVIDNTRALIQLFKIQLENAKSVEDKSFDEFLTWGITLLADFNEIDRYQLDAKQVFRNLADIKEIENWSFGEDRELTESQKRFMEFWDRLPGYYYALEKRLSESDLATTGRAYKELSENVDRLFRTDQKRAFLFAGFNALSKSELQIIRQLTNMGRAHVLIDSDAYYLNQKTHEAGEFMRVLSSELDNKKLSFVKDNLITKDLKVEMIECSQVTGQVKVAATILSQLSKDQLDETLLLLADESLISSVVKNLPKNLGKANITLGLPIRNTAIKTWVELLFSIQENKRRFKTKALYFNDIQNLWAHPFVLAMLPKEEKDLLIQAEYNIVNNNRIFINPDNLQIGPMTSQLMSSVTVDWNDNWPFVTQNFRAMNRLIYENLETEFAFERAILECFDKTMQEFENLVNEGLPEMSLQSFKHLFNQHWGQGSISYHGNPMDGLQIMGLLETRGLDFKRIICLGMNEGNLPPTNPIQTMIPMDLRRYHGLPTPREKQGLFAHHFYRLLHSCEELFVTYCSAQETFGSSEPSRYLMQLEMELSRINPNIKIDKKIYSVAAQEEEIVKEFDKTPEIISRLDELFTSSTSASMLKNFFTCPLDFYYKYVMDFGEADSVEEDIEHSTFGTFIHDTLEELFMPFARFDKEGNEVKPAPSNITSIDVEKMLESYKIVLHEQFMRHFNNDKNAFMKGKNLLSYKMAMELTERFLKSEIDFLSQQTESVFIEALERKYETEVEVRVGGVLKKVKLRGFIDRIDSIGNKIRIIDYKSGKVDAKDVKILKGDGDVESIVKRMGMAKHVLQLMLYAFLYKQKENKFAEPSIISFVSNNNKPFVLEMANRDFQQTIDEFPLFLESILNDIYNVDEPFTHVVKGQYSYCQYC